MRKVLSSTAGATFHEETPTFTINVKKEMIELIYKLAPSWYVIVNVLHASEKELLLCCEWGHSRVIRDATHTGDSPRVLS